MPRTKLIFSGREPQSPTAVGTVDADVVFDPQTGFAKTAPGVVSLSAVVLPSSFDGAQLAPTQLEALAFTSELDPSLTADEIRQFTALARGVSAVTKPGLIQVDVPGLDPATEYFFVLLADFPS